ncbi:hypothetical protein FACS189459_0180 [Bacilli bacterium]|nr:hypothetical protein FACS189459_0180 [Bacilli bacterium]
MENKLFSSINKSKKNFSIIIPPPNVTGKLHIGHALDTSIQDTIIRYKKLSGYNALYIPGTDHAGISAQTKFQSVLKENGVDHVSMSNEVFLEKLNLWVLDQIKYIHQQ